MTPKKQPTKSKLSRWFSRPLTRHVMAGLVVLGLQNLLISQHIPPNVAVPISTAVGKLIEGQ